MEIVYYCTADGIAPARVYMESRYGVLSGDSPKVTVLKIKTLGTVDSVIKMTADSKDGRAGGTFSSPLTGYSFSEFRFKEGDELVRILYFPYELRQIVLLDAYDKPENYSKAEKKRVEKRIEGIHERVQGYYNDFIDNPKHHEKY